MRLLFFCWNLSPAGPSLGLALARASGGVRSNSSFSSLRKRGGDRRLGVLPPPTSFPPSFFPKMSEVHLGPPFLPPKEAIWRISRQLARRRRGGGRGVCSDERRKEEEERLSMFSQRRRRRSMEKEEEESAEEDF